MAESHLWRALLTQTAIRHGRLQTTSMGQITRDEKEAQVDTEITPTKSEQKEEQAVEEEELELKASEIPPITINNNSAVEVHLSPFMPAGIGYRELFFYSTAFPTQIDDSSSTTFNTKKGSKHQLKSLPSLPPITYLKGVKASIQKPIDLAEKRQVLKAARAAATLIAFESKDADESIANPIPGAPFASDEDSDLPVAVPRIRIIPGPLVDAADNGDEVDRGFDYLGDEDHAASGSRQMETVENGLEVQRGRFIIGQFLETAPITSSRLSRFAYIGKRQGNNRCVRTDVPFPTRFHRGTGLPFLNVCWVTRKRYEELKRQEEIERLLVENIKDEQFVNATTLVKSKTNDSESSMTDIQHTSTTSVTPMKRKCMDPAAASSSSSTTLTVASSSTSAVNGADAKKQKTSSLSSFSFDDSDTSYSVSPSAFIPLVRLSYLAYFEIMIQDESLASKSARLADPTQIHYDASKHVGCIGLGTEHFKLQNLVPGWDSNSYGYHSDDGRVYYGFEMKDYSVTGFGPGDVVGCGYDLKRGQIFFTKNGKHLGLAFRNVYETLYPMIGVDAPWRIQLNLGSQYPFVFDVIKWEKELMKQLPLTQSKHPFSLSCTATESSMTSNSSGAAAATASTHPHRMTPFASSAAAAQLRNDYQIFQALKHSKIRGNLSEHDLPNQMKFVPKRTQKGP